MFFKKTVLTLLLLSVIGFSSFQDYGLSSDEPAEVGMVKMNAEYIIRGKPFSGDLKYYGTVFNFASEATFQVSELIQKGFSYNPFADFKDKGDDQTGKQLLSRITIKHGLTFAVSLTAYLLVAHIVSILSGPRYAWLGVISLALMPRFYGHSFFNPKDIPFAVIFTAATVLGAYLVDYATQDLEKEDRGPLFLKRSILWFTTYGIVTGIATSIRLGGFVLLGFMPVSYLIVKRHLSRKRLLQFSSYCLVMVMAWALTVTICHPASWKNPVMWFLDGVTYLSNHRWNGYLLFHGNLIRGGDVPWTYLPTWLLITTPTIFVISFLIGLVLITRRYQSFSVLQKSCTVLLALQIFALPLVAILKGSTIYDGLRQFLFILPPIAALSTFAIVEIYKGLPWKQGKLFVFGLIGVIFAHILSAMVFLHPYQYTYFSKISRHLLSVSSLYETDYYGLSAREAMEWVNDNAPSTSRVLVGAPSFYSARSFGRDSFDYAHLSLSDTQESSLPMPYFYIAIPTTFYQTQLPECEPIYQVMRSDITMATVRKCN